MPAAHRLPGDTADEPLDPTEATDFDQAQSVGEELRELSSREPAPLPLLEVTEDEEGKELPEPDLTPKVVVKPLMEPKVKDAFSALMNRVRSRVAEGDQIKAERKLLAGAVDAGGLTPAAREALRAKILKWEAETEWKPFAALQVIEVQECACGLKQFSTYGLFQRQERRLSEADVRDGKTPAERLVRWSPQDLNDAGIRDLPRQLTRRFKKVSVCEGCVESWNFVQVEVQWEKFDVTAVPGVSGLVGGELPRMTVKGKLAGETVPKGKPVQAPPKGQLSHDEEFELNQLISKSLTPGQHLDVFERARWQKLLDKANFGESETNQEGE